MIVARRIRWLVIGLMASYAVSIGGRGGSASRLQYCITDYGAVGDGRTLNTAAIQQAIMTASTQGGGTVVVPEGVFLTGGLVLVSGIELRIQKNATLLGSTNPLDYTRTSGHPGLIVADTAMGISITGGGSIDGQGLQLALTIDSLYRVGQFNDPQYSRDRYRPSEAVRPYVLGFTRCSNIVVKGVTVRNGAGWVQVYTLCDRLSIDSVLVESIAYWNNDGIDICDCRNVSVTHCTINTADDGICLKSQGADACVDSVAISHCTVRSSASAVKFGSDSRGGFRNVTVSHLTVFDTYRSAIAIECVDGGVVENIAVSDVQARNTGNAFFIRLGHRNPDERISTVKDVTIENLRAEIPFGRPDINYDLRGPETPFNHNPFPASITGIPGHPVRNVTLKNIVVDHPGRGTKGMAYASLSSLDRVPEAEKNYPEFSMFGELPAWGLYVRHAAGLTIEEMALHLRESDYRPACVFDDAEAVRVEEPEILSPDNRPAIVLRNVRKGIIGRLKVNGTISHSILQLGACESIEEH